VEGVSVGHAVGQNPGSLRQPPMAPAERLGPWNGGRAGTPCGVPFIEVVRPLCDAEKSEGEGRGPDRGQHVVRGAGSAAENGPTVHGGVADRRGKTRHVAGDDFKAPRSAPGRGSLGKVRTGWDAKAAIRRAGGVAACLKMSDRQRLTDINSNFCN
jgi:hypothetical protein